MEVEYGAENNGDSSAPVEHVVLRIYITEHQYTDWKVDHDLTFHELLDVVDGFMQANGLGKPSAFDYEDEDGDKITVRSDEELIAMITWHQSTMERLTNGISKRPLNVYPRMCRTSSKRNPLGLTVDVGASPTASSNVEKKSSGSSGRKQPEDIETILKSGHIQHGDIHYMNVIGHGNGGSVYKAFHVPSQQNMAIKVVALDITEAIQREILSELNILFTCHSPYIIDFCGAFFIENKISICTEFMDGGSIDRYGKIPQNVLARVAVAVVKGLQYLWNLKIIHRDLKPNNILVNSKGQVKLCDFGVSIQLVNSIAKTYVGTNCYMAPERIMGDEYGIHSDVWSLGLSLVEMSTGTFPYPANTNTNRDTISPIELLQCIVHENPPKLSRDMFADALRDFVNICLHKNPKMRPTPEQLSRHPFIVQNDTENQYVIIAEFVSEALNMHLA